jgi:hypothetical protein
MDKQSINLRTELDQPQLNRAAIRAIAQKLNDARARRFERELMMFIDMRAVLNDGQWNRMRTALDRMTAEGAAPDRPREGLRRNGVRRP